MYKILLSLGLRMAAETSTGQQIAYNALSTLTAVGAGLLTRKLLSVVWTKVSGREPPQNPADPTVDWREAVTWAGATGVGVGVGRLVGRRLAADVWEKTSGKPAPTDRDT